MSNIYAVYDRPAGIYMAPVMEEADALVIREFREIVNDKQTLVGKYPEDYALYRIGVMDTRTGRIESLPAPVCIINAIDLVTPTASPSEKFSLSEFYDKGDK